MGNTLVYVRQWCGLHQYAQRVGISTALVHLCVRPVVNLCQCVPAWDRTRLRTPIPLLLGPLCIGQFRLLLRVMWLALQ